MAPCVTCFRYLVIILVTILVIIFIIIVVIIFTSPLRYVPFYDMLGHFVPFYVIITRSLGCLIFMLLTGGIEPFWRPGRPVATTQRKAR